jgi:hypothetical protein
MSHGCRRVAARWMNSVAAAVYWSLSVRRFAGCWTIVAFA